MYLCRISYRTLLECETEGSRTTLGSDGVDDEGREEQSYNQTESVRDQAVEVTIGPTDCDTDGDLDHSESDGETEGGRGQSKIEDRGTKRQGRTRWSMSLLPE
jgi:hypothetical protein